MRTEACQRHRYSFAGVEFTLPRRLHSGELEWELEICSRNEKQAASVISSEEKKKKKPGLECRFSIALAAQCPSRL
jgi:hypothetical protein